MARAILTEIGNTGQKTRRYFQRSLPSDPTKDYYYIMRDTTYLQPISVEYGFLDNAADAARLKENWEKYAEATVKAVVEYVGLPYTAPEAGKIVYIVKAGDTLWSIANKFNITVQEIKDLNNLTSNVITIGQQLFIPGTGVETPPPSGNIVYVVKAGDNLFSIANRFDTTVEAIMTLNNLTSTVLSIGQQLFIPGVSIEVPGTEPFPYTIVAGDTLWSIANKFNTTVEAIMTLNNLTSTVLNIGQQILIPRPSIQPSTFEYVVQAGDSLWSIANRFNTTVEEIMTLNNLTTTLLSIGQTLLIPSPSSSISHTVQAGDSLWSIANRFNTTVEAIMALNNLTNTALSIGQQLLIPR